MQNKKLSLSTLFSNTNKKEETKKTTADQIKKIREDIEVYLQVINMAEKHIAHKVIPKFKEEKQEIYYKIIKMVSVNEIHN